MRSIEPVSGGSPIIENVKTPEEPSLTWPFGVPVSFSSIGGPTYVTAQTLIQQVAYALSDKLFTYSPETFDLDVAVKQWASKSEQNANGYTTSVQSMQTRQGAGNIALGYIFSKDFDLKKRHIPQSIIASSATLQYLRPALEQLSLLYSVANPSVAHISAVDYIGGNSGGFVTDYSTALTLADELGLGLVSSFSSYEAQHMALFSTLLATVLPTVHIYDGIKVGRETTRVIDVFDQGGLDNTFKTVLKDLSGTTQKHLDAEGKLVSLLKAFNGELGTDYGLFEYHGHPEATSVLVSFGTVEASLTAQVAASLSQNDARVGVVNVRVYRPFVEEEFLRVLPATTKTVGILGQVQSELAVQEDGVHSALYHDVLTALTFGNGPSPSPDCVELKYPISQSWNLINIAAEFQRIVEKPLLTQAGSNIIPLQLLDTTSVKEYTFWDLDNSTTNSAALELGRALSKDSTQNVTTNTTLDNLVQGGLVRTDIRKSSKTLDAPYSVGSADVVYVGDAKLFSEIAILDGIKDSGRVILKAPSVKDDELEKKIPDWVKQVFSKRRVALYVLDPSVAEDPSLETVIFQAAFLRVALPNLETVSIKKLASVLGSPDNLAKVTESLEKMLREIEIPESWAPVEGNTLEIPKVATDIRPTSFAPYEKAEVEDQTLLKDWKTTAKTLAFKEAYGTKNALRPDVPTKTFTVHVSENRRLTPVTYDRNIFHIEFDLGDSGLKYDIGEALGVHAENRAEEVQDFILFYGLNPDEIVEVPSREDPSVLESRTVYQSLIYNVDIFGRPPKRFYEALAEFATNEKEKKELLALGGPEGAVEFKRRAEVDTVTYADILLEFPSARPNFHDLVRIVTPMKRREYSIASCQKVTPNAVALMIVVVNWVDSRGRDRFGQASHYLSKLKPGTPVTVSVKPSVMKLPPKPTQPLIMAGLGTGLAPFRAFVQHRAMEKAQGKEIGSVLLYMGSRHQREEYCYGEEWEAYQDAGVITLLGRAFSRDQPQKIYIQDRMRQTLPEIAQAYLREEGAFYLCGPTWPVPDVTEVLEEAIASEAKASGVGKKVDPRKEIEKLKEELRYVLEVY